MYPNIFWWITFFSISFSSTLASGQEHSLIKFELLNTGNEKNPNQNQCDLLPETCQSKMVKIDQLNELKYLLKLTIADENLLNGTVWIISEKSQNKIVQNQWSEIIMALDGKMNFLPSNIKIERHVTSADKIVNYLLNADLVLKLSNDINIGLKYNLNLIIQENLLNLNLSHLDKLNCPWLHLNHSLRTEPPSILEFQSAIENRCPNVNDVRIFIQLASDFWPMANFVLNQQFNFDANGNEQMTAQHALFDVLIMGKWWLENKINEQISKYEKEMHLKIKSSNTYIHAYYSHLKKLTNDPVLFDKNYLDIKPPFQFDESIRQSNYLPYTICSIIVLLIGILILIGYNLYLNLLIISIFVNIWLLISFNYKDRLLFD